MGVIAWGATLAKMELLMRISAWQRIEFVVNIETGVCEVFVEHADDKRETPNAFIKRLKASEETGGVGLFGIRNDGNTGAAAAIERIRDASKEAYCLHGWRGKLCNDIARRIDLRASTAGGAATGGADAFMPMVDEMKKIQAAIEVSKLETTRLEGSTTSIREATDGISQNMARKTDTDAITEQMASLRKTIDERDAQINKLTDHNRRQGYVLGELRGIQTDLAQITADRDGLREQRNIANDALQRERAAHAGTMQQLTETRIVLDRERDAAMDARNAAAYDLRLVTDDLRELQQARSQWETERQRLMSLADNNRNAIMDAIAETLLGKRARTHQHDDDDYTQPPSGGAA